MDGYAVRAEDTYGASDRAPAVLEEVESVGPKTAVPVHTGSELPEGADAVVMVEYVERAGGELEVLDAVTPGENVTPVAASPTVGVISTGDELVAPGEPLHAAAGEIYDVNGVAISSAITEAGGDAVRYPTVGDDPAAMENVIREAAGDCDLVCTSGSTSASVMDVVYRVVEDEGDLLLHGVAVKPGKPTLVGRIDGTPFVGLPGYPVSALTIFRTFVAPAIRDAAGLSEPVSAIADARMAVRERFGEGRQRLVPVGLVEDGDGDVLAHPVDKGSGATSTLVDADGVVVVSADTEYLSPDEHVTVDLFSADVRPPRVLVVGEDDPVLSRVLDDVDRPRLLARGSRGGIRSLRDGVADVGIVAGPLEPDGDVDVLGRWTREWGLIVPDENPSAVSGIADLVDRDLSFVNRDDVSGLRASLDEALDSLATRRDESREALASAIRGYDLTTRAHESPARRVARGDADVGLGLRSTVRTLDVGFVSIGVESVCAFAAPELVDKPGVRELGTTFHDLEQYLDELNGVEKL